jgi:phage-related protein
MKPVRFLGDSLKRIREFPADVKQDTGYQLDKLQRGQQPDDFKPMPAVGKGVEEIRIWDDSGTYRVLYTARLVDAVYVFHAFQKKTQRTPQHEIDVAKARFNEFMRERK